MGCRHLACAFCKYEKNPSYLCKKLGAAQQHAETNITMLEVIDQYEDHMVIQGRHRTFGVFIVHFVGVSPPVKRVKFFIQDYEHGQFGDVSEMITELPNITDKDDTFPNKIWTEFLSFLDYDKDSKNALPDTWKGEK